MRLVRIFSALAAVLALTIASLGAAPSSQALGPGGWDRLGSRTAFGNPASSLNGDVMAMTTDYPGILIAGGKFTDAAGIPGADKVAYWDGASWHAVGPPDAFNGDVLTVLTVNGKVYVGGSFTNAGGDPAADFLAVYDGTVWKPACSGPIGGNVHALRVVGNSLYIGGAFQDGGGIAIADYLLRCDLATGAPSATTSGDPLHTFNGAVYALTSDNAGNLYVGGGFSNLDDIQAADKVARLSPAGWAALGSGAGPCQCAVDDFVRSLASDGTNVYVGTDSTDVAGIPQADHVARWNGASWSALGSNAGGTDGYLPAVTSIDALFASGSHVYASGNWLDVGGNPTADYLADFDGTSWKPVGSNGAGNGALTAKGESFAMFKGVLHVGGNFTKAGGDVLAQFIARYTGVPLNTISVGKATLDKTKGTAKLSVTVPGSGALTLSGKGVKGQAVQASGAGGRKLTIKAKGRTLDKLKENGTVKVSVTVTFTPTGGFPRAATKKVKLVLKP